MNYRNEKEFKASRNPTLDISLTDREYSVVMNALDTMIVKYTLPEPLCDDCYNDLVSVIEIIRNSRPSDTKPSERPWLFVNCCDDDDCVSYGVYDDNTSECTHMYLGTYELTDELR